MAKRVLKKKETPITKQTTEETVDKKIDEATEADRKEAEKALWDDVLDNIDEVLEKNAEEFVRSYQQKGGE